MSKASRHVILQAAGLIPALLLPLLAACVLRGQPASQPAEDLLANERWVAQGLGISLRPPLGAKLVRQTVADSLVKILCTNGCNIDVAIRDFKDDLTLKEVELSAIKQVSDARPSAKVLSPKVVTVDGRVVAFEPKPVTLGGKEAALVTIKFRDLNTGPTIISQAITLLSPRKALVITAQVDARLFNAAKPLWDQLLASVVIDDPVALAKLRRQMIEDGARWHDSVDAKRILGAIVPHQWFRIVDGNEDIGYIYIHQTPVKRDDKDNKLHLDGANVFVQTCVSVGGKTMLSDGDFYLSGNNQNELWTIRTITGNSKPPSPDTKYDPRVTPPGAAWTEIGTRDGNRLHIEDGAPDGPQKRMTFDLPQSTYTRPGEPEPVTAYLSQVEQQLIGRLLTPGDAKTLGFYSFSASAAKLEFRSERVEVNKNGSYRVMSRLAPGQEEQAAEYDPAGNLKRVVLPSGNVLLPVTQDRLIAIWKVKEMSNR